MCFGAIVRDFITHAYKEQRNQFMVIGIPVADKIRFKKVSNTN